MKICFIGAGSTVFMRNLVGDVLLREPFRECEIALMDIDPRRLDESRMVAEKLARGIGAAPRITATTERGEALDGADYVVVAIQVAGYEPGTVRDFEIPNRMGLRQTIADTLGVGGIMRGLRTVPVLLEIAADMRARCPGALMLQYVNPMAINCWALQRLAPDLRLVGLCHSVQGTAEELARDLGEPPESLSYRCAGINHMAFYTRLEKIHGDGAREDLYPRLHALAASGDVAKDNRVRYEVLRRTGYFVTESSEHFAEYVPWFIKRDRPDLIERFAIPLDEYPRRCEQQIAEWHAEVASLEAADAIAATASNEYCAQIIAAEQLGETCVVNGNVANHGLIDNLPQGCTVELPCLVDRDGVSPMRVGALPPQLAALMQTSVNVQALTVEALATRRREHVYHAAMLDPHTAAELDLDQIWSLVDELLEAHRDWLPELS